MGYGIKANYKNKMCLVIRAQEFVQGKFGVIADASDGQYAILLDGDAKPTNGFHRGDFVVVGDMIKHKVNLTTVVEKGVVRSFNKEAGTLLVQAPTGYETTVGIGQIKGYIEHIPQRTTGLMMPSVEFLISRGKKVEEAPESRKAVGQNWRVSGAYLSDIEVMNLAKKNGFSCQTLKEYAEGGISHCKGQFVKMGN